MKRSRYSAKLSAEAKQYLFLAFDTAACTRHSGVRFADLNCFVHDAPTGGRTKANS